MILSNVAIHQALDEGRLIIDPEPWPRQAQADGADCPYQTSAVDLRLGDEISYFKSGLPLNIDLRRGKFAQFFGNNSEKHQLHPDHPYVLKHGEFVLGKTKEKVALPIIERGQCLAARVEGKSSYARCGLLVHFTAPTIHSGFAGTITLELINLGPCDIALYAGAPICQLIVETVLDTPFRNDSQFQNQSSAGGQS